MRICYIYVYILQIFLEDAKNQRTHSFVFLLYTFIQNPSSLVKAQEEVDRVLQGRRPTYDDIKDLKYLTRCINESMRLYPHPPVGCIPFL